MARNVLLFGGSGQIGTALSRSAHLVAPTLGNFRSCPWSQVATQTSPRDLSHLPDLIKKYTDSWGEFDIVFANGLTDPNRSAEELMFSNTTFPLAVMEATRDQPGTRYLTIGTVFELFLEYAAANAYVRSKLELSRALTTRTSLVQARRVLHLRLHTIYGGRPKPGMFLGQLIHALKNGGEFRMSSGNQLREYHHVDDIAGAIATLLARDWTFGPVLELSSGLPLRLTDLATAAFSHCGRLDLLKIGMLPTSDGENRTRVFMRSDPVFLPYFRNPITAVLEEVKQELSNPREPF